MKNIVKTGKRSIAAILTLCLLFGIAGTCVYAASVMPEEKTVVTEETTVAPDETTAVAADGVTIVIEESIVASEDTTPELVPMMANQCGDDDYYIEGEPYLPVGAIPIGDSVIGSYVSASFLSFVVGLGYPDTHWYYYMQDYLLPNGQTVKYHIWANDFLDIVFHHRR